MKPRLSVAFALFVMASVHCSYAEVFEVEIALTTTRGATLLDITEVSPMISPELIISKDTLEGANCVINDAPNTKGHDNRPAFPANSLCPLQTGKKAQYQASGIANSYIYAKAYAEKQVDSGVEFNFVGFEGNYRLSSTGTITFTMAAILTAVDPDEAKTGILTYHYNFEAFYQ